MISKNETRYRVPRKVYEFSFRMDNGDTFKCEAANLDEAMQKRKELYSDMPWTISFGDK